MIYSPSANALRHELRIYFKLTGELAGRPPDEPADPRTTLVFPTAAYSSDGSEFPSANLNDLSDTVMPRFTEFLI
jgi:hypothetical protein